MLLPLPRSLAPFALLLAACTGCGDDGGPTADAAPPDPCAPNMTFTGEFLDWDSGGSVGFMGIPFANFTLRSDATKTDETAPNGRFEMCIPPANGFVDVSPMAGSDYVSGVVVVDRATLISQQIQSYRSFKMTRAMDFGFSPSMAHVYVHVNGGSRTVTTAATPGTMQIFANGTWSAGNTGSDIYLGNIPPSANTTLSISGGDTTHPAQIPLSIGQFTFVTIVAK